MDVKGILHAANPGKHRVERYAPEGELLGQFGRFDGRDPAGFSGCCNPTNVAVTDGGRIWVTEKAGPRAMVYDSSGKLLEVIATRIFDPNCKNMAIAACSKRPSLRRRYRETPDLRFRAAGGRIGGRMSEKVTRRGCTPRGGSARPGRAPRSIWFARPMDRSSGTSMRPGASTAGWVRLASRVCGLCTTECVVSQSAVRAVNEFSKCGRV